MMYKILDVKKGFLKYGFVEWCAIEVLWFWLVSYDTEWTIPSRLLCSQNHTPSMYITSQNYTVDTHFDL